MLSRRHLYVRKVCYSGSSIQRGIDNEFDIISQCYHNVRISGSYNVV